jgi:propionyl-CoA carboxylase alpha chain
MVKASAGGGGKGMRVAWNDEEAKVGFRLSKSEAMSSFGDDTIFLEKFIEDPRHIEIQVLCDQFGNGLWVNERECSIQRRNQKVLEEAPSTFLDPETRRAMGEQAVALAKAVQYESAGTVEFLVDKHRNFYFLEMNTRLQVEHPVTEFISGIDLVEQMIRVAAGHKLDRTQEDIGITGWSVEARVYAEDPYNEFLPSIGKLTKYAEPTGKDGDVRVDSGVVEGDDISIYYDPLISKLVTYGATRQEANDKMREALDSYVIRGVTSNISFLRALMDHPKWLSGDITTKFIEEEFPGGFKGVPIDARDKQVLVSAALGVYMHMLSTQLSVSGKRGPLDEGAFIAKKMRDMIVTMGEEDIPVQVGGLGHSEAGSVLMWVSGEKDVPVQATCNYDGNSTVFTVDVDGKPMTLQLLAANDGLADISVQYRGTAFTLAVRTRRERELFEIMPEVEKVDTARMILSPMPGRVVGVSVKVGDQVNAGQEVCVIEAMKMQNAIKAVRNSTVKSVLVTAGQTVTSQELLVEME